MEQIEAGAAEISGDGVSEAKPAPAGVDGVRDAQPANRGALVDLLRSLLIAVLAALFITTFVIQPYKIPSDSMEPTLLVGDRLLVNKFIFAGNGAWYEKFLAYRAIRRGDVIIFKYPFDDNPDYVKRVIGLPGDRLRIIAGRVFINGKLLDEPYVEHAGFNADAGTDYFPPLDPYTAETGLLPQWAAEISHYTEADELVVPPGRYFVMGDNRDDSEDSRYWGFVDRTAITGKPMLIYWSVKAGEEDYEGEGVWATIKGIADTLAHLRSRTRWHRLLREVH